MDTALNDAPLRGLLHRKPAKMADFNEPRFAARFDMYEMDDYLYGVTERAKDDRRIAEIMVLDDASLSVVIYATKEFRRRWDDHGYLPGAVAEHARFIAADPGEAMRVLLCLRPGPADILMCYAEDADWLRLIATEVDLRRERLP